MKNLLYIFILILLVNCTRNNDNIASPNLILNSSFENNSGFDFQNWDGAIYSSSSDTPTNGGNYSLQLEAGWLPGIGYAQTKITNLQGNLSFHFSSDAKVRNDYWNGKIRILLKEANDSVTELSRITFDNTSWENVSCDFIANLSVNDTLIVRLLAGGSENTLERAFFDNVTLTHN